MLSNHRLIKRAASPSATQSVSKRIRNEDPVPSIAEKVQVEIDETFQPRTGHEEVYVANDGTVYDAALGYVDIAKGLHKYFHLQVIKTDSSRYCYHWHWSSAGHPSASGRRGDDTLDSAPRIFRGYFEKKTGLSWEHRSSPPIADRYQFHPVVYTSLSRQTYAETSDLLLSRLAGIDIHGGAAGQISIPQATKDLLNLLYNGKLKEAKYFFTFGNFATSFGAVPLNKILESYKCLARIAAMIAPSQGSQDQNTFAATLLDQSNEFYRLIPQNPFTPAQLAPIDCVARIVAERNLLDGLSGLSFQESSSYSATYPSFLQGLGLKELKPLEAFSTEFRALNKHMLQTQGKSHGFNLRTKGIYRIERFGEDDRLVQHGASRPNSRPSHRLLWHGSPVRSFPAILKEGLQVMHGEARGLYGKGLYFADCSTKSALYCQPNVSQNNSLLLLCVVDVQHPQRHMHEWGAYGDPRRHAGQGSVRALGKSQPYGWKDASIVHDALKGVRMPDRGLHGNGIGTLNFNEYIVYCDDQVKLKYLFWVERVN